MNELLLFSTIIVAFFSLLLMFRLWGRTGIYIWAALASVIANIEVLKCVDIFGISTTLGNVVYGSTFLATDILSQLYGGKEARRAVKVGFAALRPERGGLHIARDGADILRRADSFPLLTCFLPCQQHSGYLPL